MIFQTFSANPNLLDKGNTYDELDNSIYDHWNAGYIALGPGNTLLVCGRGEITALNDRESGNPFGGGMGYLDNTPPLTASNIGISDGASNQATSFTLSWQASDPDDGQNLKYSLYMGSYESDSVVSETPTGEMKLIADDIINTQYNVEGLQDGKEYHWQVVATDGQAISVSPVWKFITGPRPGVEDGNSSLPKEFKLEQNSPNPFNPLTTITYSIPSVSSVSVTLKIYDIRGSLVRILVDEKKSSGTYSVVWDGRDDRDHQVSTGIYLYSLHAGTFIKTHKMILMK